MSSDSTKRRIVIAGTGGQGVITAARFLSEFFARRGRQVVSGQLHGMAQRGGAVQSSVMIDCGISPAMSRGSADVVLGLEPVETVRVLPYVGPSTTVFMNCTPVVPYVLSQHYVLGQGAAAYPDLDELHRRIRAITARLHVLDATAMAREAGSVRTVNVVMLGCLFGAGLLPAPAEEFLNEAIRNAPPKLVETNHQAFLRGVEFGRSVPCLEEVP